MVKYHKFKLVLIRATSVLLAVVYFREWIWIAISSGDFRPTVVGLGFVLAFICNTGLWMCTLPVGQRRRVLVSIALLPSFIVAPMLVGGYHFSLAIFVLIVSAIAAQTLFEQRGSA